MKALNLHAAYYDLNIVQITPYRSLDCISHDGSGEIFRGTTVSHISDQASIIWPINFDEESIYIPYDRGMESPRGYIMTLIDKDKKLDSRFHPYNLFYSEPRHVAENGHYALFEARSRSHLLPESMWVLFGKGQSDRPTHSYLLRPSMKHNDTVYMHELMPLQKHTISTKKILFQNTLTAEFFHPEASKWFDLVCEPNKLRSKYECFIPADLPIDSFKIRFVEKSTFDNDGIRKEDREISNRLYTSLPAVFEIYPFQYSYQSLGKRGVWVEASNAHLFDLSFTFNKDIYRACTSSWKVMGTTEYGPSLWYFPKLSDSVVQQFPSLKQSDQIPSGRVQFRYYYGFEIDTYEKWPLKYKREFRLNTETGQLNRVYQNVLYAGSLRLRY